ncbi:MAG: GIY-YIG nuclease family protein [Patescibacteria group bacterium]
MREFFVYILTNPAHTVLYTGVTNSLFRRIQEHKAKKIPGFTQKYNVTKLVYFDSCGNPTTAIEEEKRIKGWKRQKKIELINSQNPDWKDLFEELS